MVYLKRVSIKQHKLSQNPVVLTIQCDIVGIERKVLDASIHYSLNYLLTTTFLQEHRAHYIYKSNLKEQIDQSQKQDHERLMIPKSLLLELNHYIDNNMQMHLEKQNGSIQEHYYQIMLKDIH